MGKAPLLGFVMAVLPLTTAQAAQATAEEAGRLTTLFQTLCRNTGGGAAECRDGHTGGESYRVALDVQQVLRGFESFGVSADPSVSTTMLTPLADGTWKVVSAGSPPIVVHVRDQSIAMTATSALFDGIYDPRMFAFKTAEAQYSGYGYTSTKPGLAQNSHSDKIGFTFAGTPAEGGTVDGTVHELVAGTKVDIVIKPPSPQPPSATEAPAAPAPPAAAPPTAISYAAPTATLDLGMEKLHSKNLLDLWAFLVAHPDHERLVAAQDELRGILRAVLPLASALKERATAEGLSITTPIGPFSIKSASGGFDVVNLDGTAKATTSIAVGALTVPPGQCAVGSRSTTPVQVTS